MKALFYGGMIFCFATIPSRAHLEEIVTIEALRLVEDSKYYEVGPKGERSQWQISPEVWKTWSAVPFERASRREYQEEARRVAKQQVGWLNANLVNPSPFRLALAWNAGLGAVNESRIPESSFDFARRFVNLYEEIISKEVVEFGPR